MPYSDFTKRIVEEYVEWRKTFRAMTDRRSGAVSAETINKEVSEANRCIQWARAERIVQSECNAFYKVKVRKDASNTRIIEPLTMEDQNKMLEWLRQCGNPWAHDAFLFLLLTGMRISDWESLDAQSFDLKEGVIRLHKVSIGIEKNHRMKYFPLNIHEGLAWT